MSHSEKDLARCRQKCRKVFMQSTHYSFRILMELEYARHIFEKGSNIKFHQIRPVRAELLHAD